MHNLTFYVESFLGALVAQIFCLFVPWKRIFPRRIAERSEPETQGEILVSTTAVIVVFMVLNALIHMNPTGPVAAIVVVTIYRCWRLGLRA